MVKQFSKTATLLIYCPDQEGIVAKVTDFLHNNYGNILYLDQHVDTTENYFFMRIEWTLDRFLIPADKISEFFEIQVSQIFNMKWKLFFSNETPKMAIFVSKMSHCLFDILYRYQSGQWNVEIPLIISNHKDLESVAKSFNIPFYYFPISKTNKKEQEKKEIELLKKLNVDFIVLARYMQILSKEFVDTYKEKIINIHHSFLPAFPGAKPYHSAFKRGVKIIGATSHYVTSELDEGPIITQDTVKVTHKDDIDTFVLDGQNIEKIVLSQAISSHINRKILVYNNKTVVFI